MSRARIEGRVERAAGSGALRRAMVVWLAMAGAVSGCTIDESTREESEDRASGDADKGSDESTHEPDSEHASDASAHDAAKPKPDAAKPKPEPVEDASVRDAGTPPTGGGGGATTYTEHVRPLLNRTCVPCHQAGGAGPFPLGTYAEAKPMAAQIARATKARTMPPTPVDNSGPCNTYSDVSWLTDAEIATLQRWSAAGAPEGSSAIPAPPVRELPTLTGEIKSIKTPVSSRCARSPT